MCMNVQNGTVKRREKLCGNFNERFFVFSDKKIVYTDKKEGRGTKRGGKA